MAVGIGEERLESVPSAIRLEQDATLRLVLQAHDGADEEATVEYRLNPGNDITFAENDGKVITATFDVATEPTVTERRYALKGTAGKMVQITAIVLPERVHRSKETVTLLK